MYNSKSFLNMSDNSYTIYQQQHLILIFILKMWQQHTYAPFSHKKVRWVLNLGTCTLKRNGGHDFRLLEINSFLFTKSFIINWIKNIFNTGYYIKPNSQNRLCLYPKWNECAHFIHCKQMLVISQEI